MSPRCNRVAPDGTIAAVAERGSMYGNRGGCFHRDDGTLKKRLWASPHWLVCELAFKGRQRTMLQPGRYTELFFLDEATAFAAGHRPCFECRRAVALLYQRLFAEVRGAGAGGDQRIDAAGIDDVLALERGIEPERRSRADVRDLPDGTMVLWGGACHLIWGRRLRPWSYGGYGPPVEAKGITLAVLTPQTTVNILARGFPVRVHGSAAT